MALEGLGQLDGVHSPSEKELRELVAQWMGWPQEYLQDIVEDSESGVEGQVVGGQGTSETCLEGCHVVHRHGTILDQSLVGEKEALVVGGMCSTGVHRATGVKAFIPTINVTTVPVELNESNHEVFVEGELGTRGGSRPP